MTKVFEIRRPGALNCRSYPRDLSFLFLIWLHEMQKALIVHKFIAPTNTSISRQRSIHVPDRRNLTRHLKASFLIVEML